MSCLNPCCNGRYSLSQRKLDAAIEKCEGLNPCCNGRYSLSEKIKEIRENLKRLNPCCNGRYSLSHKGSFHYAMMEKVLILVVMEDTH